MGASERGGEAGGELAVGVKGEAERGVLVVTGGASGIGAGVVRLAAARGYRVAINYRTREDEARALEREIVERGGKALAIRGDVSDAGDVERLFERASAELGAVTALVNAAGIMFGPVRVDAAEPAALERLLRVNVLGVMLCCAQAARRMSRARGGRGGVVVNVSSMAATIGGRPGSSQYAASKGAVDVFTLGFAREVAPEGMRVVAVRPGFTATEMSHARLAEPAFAAKIAASIPLGRHAQVDEVAAPIVWLLSPEASFITGACLDISGGGFVIAQA